MLNLSTNSHRTLKISTHPHNAATALPTSLFRIYLFDFQI
ncbi:hypothetical protein NEILACOT_05095 [Neisseria lactamica ATCC 23970]|uniref:Uncharacterized protein n=1 Tax=Neisseria lactamica ATCC 23970 TaxID=546265 RepID=D0WC16_NEILA|nr:hypothetical protein NEILACOT_05095 [Neisseria lactamica ATCC 23970]